tara:strand:- start:465 stop:1049 length:585 start_codon:yes stop_codon:yes gene_type:complete
MNEFRDFYEEKQIDKELNEDFTSLIGSVLGYTVVGFAVAFGGTLIALAGTKSIGILKRWWKKILSNVKDLTKTPRQVITDISRDTNVKRENAKMNVAVNKYEEDIKDVLSAIKEKDFNKAKKEYTALESKYKNSPDVSKIILMKISDAVGEPPLWVTSPGNETYQAIKKILGQRIAKAAAEVTKMSLESKVEQD